MFVASIERRTFESFSYLYTGLDGLAETELH